jgi:uncharacterized protein with PIN domain
MAARKKRSKKRSVASSNSPPEITFYIDRNLGRHAVPEALRSAGHDVQIHDDHLAPDAPDEDWIALCGRKKWVAITQDKNIRYRAAEIDAIRRNRAAVFVVRAKLLTGDQLGELLVKFARKLARFAAANEPPFVAGVDRNGRISNYPI